MRHDKKVVNGTLHYILCTDRKMDDGTDVTRTSWKAIEVGARTPGTHVTGQRDEGTGSVAGSIRPRMRVHDWTPGLVRDKFLGNGPVSWRRC